MSADKRKQILVGFGFLAVVLTAVIVYVSPTFRNENASGAIGAVQKHRAPQIQPGDVILGGDQVRKEQKIAFGDYLSDAAALRKSADVLAAQSAAAQAAIDNQERDVESQYMVSARDTIDAMQALMSEDAAALGKANIENVSADLSSLENALANARLETADELSAMNAKIKNAVSEVDSALASASFDIASEALGKASENVANLEMVRSELGRAAAAVEVASSLDLKYRMAHLEQMAKELKVIENVEALVGSAAFENARALLSQEASVLEKAALDHMQALHSEDAMEAAALGRMSDAILSLKRGLDNAASVENAKSLDMARQALDQLSREVQENQALESLELKGQLEALHSLDQAARTESFIAYENKLASASAQ